VNQGDDVVSGDCPDILQNVKNADTSYGKGELFVTFSGSSAFFGMVCWYGVVIAKYK